MSDVGSTTSTYAGYPVMDSLLRSDYQQGVGEGALPSIYRNSVNWDFQRNPLGCEKPVSPTHSNPSPSLATRIPGIGLDASQWAHVYGKQETPPSLPRQWLSGMPWSCRTCTVSLQASGQRPGLTFSTDPLPPAQGANRKLGPPSSFGLVVPSELAWAVTEGPGWHCDWKLCPRAPSHRVHLQSHPYSCHRAKTCGLASFAVSNISLESAGKVTRENHLFMTKDKTRQIVPGMLHPIRVTFKQFNRTYVEWVSSWTFKSRSLQLTCSPWGIDWSGTETSDSQTKKEKSCLWCGCKCKWC